MMIYIKRLIDSLMYLFINYMVGYIPLWNIRKLLYILCGMKIGKGSRIYMKCIIRSPWKLRIGNNTIINENCILDARGGISIGDNTSISLFTTILTGSHDSKSETFEYYKRPVIIENNVWTGVHSIVLPGSKIENECILAAGSCLKGNTECGYIYAGIPAKKDKERGLSQVYKIKHYDLFR